ncbi:MAG: DeoR/GlpR transcriptional regulator [Clostridia bacterium]|nr:DeoR/GlpR transcriptional regulator [Clostridia bacterium]
MSISNRQKQILELLEENGFLTVGRLSELTYTSPSSVRRDLIRLQNLSLVKRTHGGASALREVNQAVPLSNRMSQSIAEKRRIAKLASELLRDGQSVMLDGSSTAGFLVPYIAKHKDMILFTNNMNTAITAVSYGIATHCIGGASVNCSAVLSGTQAYAAVEGIHPDILFFSSKSLDADGWIYDPIPEENYIRTLMLKNARCRVFLCDSAKFGSTSLYRLTSIEEIDACVFDKPYPDLRAKCKIIC